MLVRECLHAAPVTVPPSCTLREGARLMERHEVGALLVADAGVLVGIVTDRDLSVRGYGNELSPDATVDEVMTRVPVTVQGSADFLEAFATLREAGVRRLPVLEDDEIAGMITTDDLLVLTVKELASIAQPAAETLRGTR